jgi:cytochrome P450
VDGVYKTRQEYQDLGLNQTVFHALLDSDLPPEEKLQSRLWQEGQVLIGAGADTTANALTITHFHILNNPEVFKKMRAELDEALPNSYDPVALRVVEQLPYFVNFVLKIS